MPSPFIFVICFQAEKQTKKKPPDLRLLPEPVLSSPLKKESLMVHLGALVNFNASLRSLLPYDLLEIWPQWVSFAAAWNGVSDAAD